jgi:pilus assembly protein CpaD
MTNIRTPLAFALATALLLGACAPVTGYTEAEAPKRLTLDTSTTRVDVGFAPGSSQLGAAEAARLHNLAATGGVGPADRVTVAAAGTSYLARQRTASIAAVLLQHGIVIEDGQLADLPPNHALIEVNRTLVTLPPCPNWSKPSGFDYGNAPSSNFACATETNLGLMVANPSDLASGRPSSGAAGQPAASAMHRYLTDKVELPTANSALPIAAQSSSGTASSGSQ